MKLIPDDVRERGGYYLAGFVIARYLILPALVLGAILALS